VLTWPVIPRSGLEEVGACTISTADGGLGYLVAGGRCKSKQDGAWTDVLYTCFVDEGCVTNFTLGRAVTAVSENKDDAFGATGVFVGFDRHNGDAVAGTAGPFYQVFTVGLPDGGRTAVPTAVTFVSDTSLIAVGHDGAAAMNTYPAALVWTSEDGPKGTWKQMPAPADAFDLSAVVGTPHGFMVEGPRVGNHIPSVWTIGTNGSWDQAIELPQASRGDEPQLVDFDTAVSSQFLWTGLATGSPVAHPFPAQDAGKIVGAVHVADGYVAVGADQVLVSSDGVNWRAASNEGLIGHNLTALTELDRYVVGTGDGFFFGPDTVAAYRLQ
jgi:hypothetical protein